VNLEINSSVCIDISNTGYCDDWDCSSNYSSGRQAYY